MPPLEPLQMMLDDPEQGDSDNQRHILHSSRRTMKDRPQKATGVFAPPDVLRDGAQTLADAQRRKRHRNYLGNMLAHVSPEPTARALKMNKARKRHLYLMCKPKQSQHLAQAASAPGSDGVER